MIIEIKPKRMLAIFAHPDDESFAAGGTLAKYAHQGVQVTLLCATRGEAGISGVTPEEAGAIREAELRKAAEHLGIEVYFLGFQDGELAQTKPETIVGNRCLLDRSRAATGHSHVRSGWRFRTPRPRDHLPYRHPGL